MPTYFVTFLFFNCFKLRAVIDGEDVTARRAMDRVGHGRTRGIE